jgi:hypothetical protein
MSFVGTAPRDADEDPPAPSRRGRIWLSAALPLNSRGCLGQTSAGANRPCVPFGDKTAHVRFFSGFCSPPAVHT